MKLGLVTQELDPAHPALAQSTDLVRALAERVDRLAVVARDVAWDAVPDNAEVRTFEAAGGLHGASRSSGALLRRCRTRMRCSCTWSRQFAVLAAPLARLRRVPLLLWYTHWHASRALRVATSLVDIVLSVDASSFPLATREAAGDRPRDRRRPLSPGQSRPPGGPLRLLALGRTARWKGLGTLLDAVRDGPRRRARDPRPVATPTTSVRTAASSSGRSWRPTDCAGRGWPIPFRAPTCRH